MTLVTLMTLKYSPFLKVGADAAYKREEKKRVYA